MKVRQTPIMAVRVSHGFPAFPRSSFHFPICILPASVAERSGWTRRRFGEGTERTACHPRHRQREGPAAKAVGGMESELVPTKPGHSVPSPNLPYTISALPAKSL